MNTGQSRRLPRTSRAMPETIPEVEREKIRHRKPGHPDMDRGDAPPRRPRTLAETNQPVHEDAVVYETYEEDEVAYEVYGEEEAVLEESVAAEDVIEDDDADDDWTAEPEEEEEPSSWDDDSEDEWELAPERDETSADIVADDVVADDEVVYGDEDGEEEGGIVWEADALDEEQPGDDEDLYGGGDEDEAVDFAGRQDIRPRSPRPAQSGPRPLAPPPPRPAPELEAQPVPRPKARRGQPGLRPSRPDWVDPGEPPIHEPPVREAPVRQVAPEPSRRRTSTPPVDRPAVPVATGGRGSGARAMINATASLLGTEKRAPAPKPAPPQPARCGPAPRRRQARPIPEWSAAGIQDAAVRFGRTPRKGMVLGLLVLLAGGWIAYDPQSLDRFQPTIDRLMAVMPFSDGARTAENTALGGLETQDLGAAQQALSELEARVRQQNGQGTAPVDPAAAGTDGPPIPQFKPLPSGG